MDLRFVPRELRPLARSLVAQGWQIEQTQKGHIRWIPPNGGDFVISGGTPSDVRAIKNIRARLRRTCAFEE